MKRLLIAVVAIFVLAQALPAQAAEPAAGFEINHVRGTLPGGGSFSGDILILEFLPEGGSKQQVRLVGVILEGTVRTAQGKAATITNEPFSGSATLVYRAEQSRLTPQQAVCDILFLDIGPMYLNVLVDISEIEIDINAIQNGGLLGDLLCSLANALQNGTPLGNILSQINQLLATTLAIL